ncbi:MAG: diguanylate cyclase [Desulfovibrio sp.]|nr:diguanylate cyclase [Desulfovibrio sp.]
MKVQLRFSSLAVNMSLLILSVLIASLAIFFASNHFMHVGFANHFQKDLETLRQVVDDELGTLKEKRFQNAVLLAQSIDLERAFHATDHNSLVRFAKSAQDRFKASFVTITDRKGTVLARSNSDRRGDNIAESSVMEQALNGKPNVDVLKLKNNGLSVAAAAPIVFDNGPIGALMVGEAFRTNSFVDEIKHTANVEMTVFDNDERLSTSIVRNGKRAVGTKLESAEVYTTVLKEGGVYSDDATILGKAYKTVYWPLRDKQEKILGMWFIGTEAVDIDHSITAIALSCLATTLVIAVALSFFGIFLVHSMVNPLEQKAYTDRLTGISNRAGFEKTFERILKTNPQKGALFLVDLDNFKDINDNLGHPFGDECLKRVANLAKEVFRDTDAIARLGGDEFIIFAPGMHDPEIIREKAKEFLDVVKYTYKVDKGNALTLTASLGISLYPDNGKTYTPLYRNADIALYSVKNSGRNNYALYNGDDLTK